MKASFKFNNSALFVDPNCSQTDAVSKMFWDMGQNSIAKFFQSLAHSEPRSLSLSKEVMEEREQLANLLLALKPQVDLLLSHASNLKEQAKQLADFDKQAEGAKNFKFTQKVQKIRKKPTRNWTTACPNCDQTCHQNCAFQNDQDKAQCIAMDVSGHCGSRKVPLVTAPELAIHPGVV